MEPARHRGVLGRSLGDVLHVVGEHGEDRHGSLFDSGDAEADRLVQVLGLVAIAFPSDVCGSCLRPAQSPSSTLRSGAVDAGELLWAVTDVLRAAVGTSAAVLHEHGALGAGTFVVPVGSEGALSVTRVGADLSPRERHLVHALGRIATR